MEDLVGENFARLLRVTRVYGQVIQHRLGLGNGAVGIVKILFLCQYFPPEMGAPAARTFEHARHWVRSGHEVTVVCGLPNHPDGVVPEKYRGSMLYRETIEGINVLRCWLFTTPNRGVFKRSICFLSFMFSSLFVGSFFTPKCDVVVATSPQMLCGLGGYVVALFKRRPYVVEIRDLWPKQIVDLGVVHNRLIIGALSWLERFMYQRAKGIITVAQATRQEIFRAVSQRKTLPPPQWL